MKKKNDGVRFAALAAAVVLTAGILAGCNDGFSIPVAPDDATLSSGEVSETSQASKKDGTNSSKNDPSGNCSIGVDLTLHAQTAGLLTSVLLGDPIGNFYSNGVDKVTAGSGSGDGFRFDTNGSQQTDHPRDKRRITLAFGDGGLDFDGDGSPDGDVLSGADYRFTGDRLDLCGLAENQSGNVPISMGFEYQDAPMSIQWGCALNPDGALTTQPATVTRLGNLASGKRQWLIEGTEACARRGWQFENEPFHTGILPFSLTIEEQ